MISDEVKADLSKSERPHIVQLFELDITKINPDGGQNVWLFCNEVNELKEPVVWRGKTFLPLSMKMEGVERKSSGPSNRPILTVGNVDGYFFGVIHKFNGLMGAKITRYQVESRHLDAVNFEGGNKQANQNEYVSDSYIINGPESYNKNSASFELALPTETDGASLPNRTILASVCPFQYRGAGCGYDGHAVADIDDMAIKAHEMDKDRCGKRLRSCMARFCENGQLPYGGFLMADKVAR